MPLIREYYRSNKCVTCLKKLNELDYDDDDKNNNSELKNESSIIKELPAIDWKQNRVSIENEFIRKYIEQNEFNFRDDVYFKKFIEKTANKPIEDIEMREELEQADGKYTGEISKGTRIANRRGIFVQN